MPSVVFYAKPVVRNMIGYASMCVNGLIWVGRLGGDRPYIYEGDRDVITGNGLYINGHSTDKRCLLDKFKDFELERGVDFEESRYLTDEDSFNGTIEKLERILGIEDVMNAEDCNERKLEKYRQLASRVMERGIGEKDFYGVIGLIDIIRDRKIPGDDTGIVDWCINGNFDVLVDYIGKNVIPKLTSRRVLETFCIALWDIEKETSQDGIEEELHDILDTMDLFQEGSKERYLKHKKSILGCMSRIDMGDLLRTGCHLMRIHLIKEKCKAAREVIALKKEESSIRGRKTGDFINRVLERIRGIGVLSSCLNN